MFSAHVVLLASGLATPRGSVVLVLAPHAHPTGKRKLKAFSLKKTLLMQSVDWKLSFAAYH